MKMAGKRNMCKDGKQEACGMTLMEPYRLWVRNAGGHRGTPSGEITQGEGGDGRGAAVPGSLAPVDERRFAVGAE